MGRNGPGASRIGARSPGKAFEPIHKQEPAGGSEKLMQAMEINGVLGC